MVELKHEDVGLAAIDTWMIKREGDHFVMVLVPTPIDLFDQARLLAFMIQVVVAPVRLRETSTAPSLARRLATPHRRELIKGFGLAASGTSPHFDTSRRSSTSVE